MVHDDAATTPDGPGSVHAEGEAWLTIELTRAKTSSCGRSAATVFTRVDHKVRPHPGGVGLGEPGVVAAGGSWLA
jgi:hypothetical protein